MTYPDPTTIQSKKIEDFHSAGAGDVFLAGGLSSTTQNVFSVIHPGDVIWITYSLHLENQSNGPIGNITLDFYVDPDTSDETNRVWSDATAHRESDGTDESDIVGGGMKCSGEFMVTGDMTTNDWPNEEVSCYVVITNTGSNQVPVTFTSQSWRLMHDFVERQGVTPMHEGAGFSEAETESFDP